MSTDSKDKMNTTQLMSMIKNSSDFSEVDEILRECVGSTEFCHCLYDTMSRHGMRPKDVISLSEMERSYFYHILSGSKIPLRNIVIRIALCIGADLAETNRLLLLAQQGTLYAKIRRDAAIIFCIENGKSMREANDLLLSLGEAPLYKD